MDEKYIKIALKMANKAKQKDEVPVGAVIVENNKIIAKGYNKRNKNKEITSHAEINVINKACKKKKSLYLNDCILYVTLEPCMMCTGAIIQSHIKKVVYCTKSPKYGFLSTIKKINDIEIIENINSEESSKILKDFFALKRKK